MNLTLNAHSSLIVRARNNLAYVKRMIASWYRCFKYRDLVKSNIIPTQGVKLYLDPYISPHVRGTIFNGSYEATEVKLIRSQLTSQDVVMEIGAGLGLISCFCAKQIGGDRVFAYEANPALERLIRKNYELNGVSPHLEICLLGDRTGEATFYIEADFWSSSIIRRSPNAEAIKVPVKLLNDEIRKINPTFLVLDIEGGEYDLLQYIDFHTIKTIVIEVHKEVLGPEKTRQVMEKLEQAGFKADGAHSSKQELLFRR